MKPLVLINQTDNDYFPHEMESCVIRVLYNSNSIVNRIIRKLVLRYNFRCGIRYIFKHWIKDVEQADTIIIFDTGNASYISSFLKNSYPNKRVIVWYWNSVTASISVETVGKEIEVWSFDPMDCKKYGMRFNTQFFIEDNLKRRQTIDQLYDVFYVGLDKDRARYLKKLKDVFQENGISYYFNLVKYHNSTNDAGIEYKQALSYKDVLGYIYNSKVVVDLVADWQSGLTLRPLEALFYKKKLITNMKKIADYDIYNRNNIYIIGVDSWKDLPAFIMGKYDDEQHAELCQKYSFDSWIKRFDNEE